MARILIADDNDAIRFGVRRFLEASGFTVVEETHLAGIQRRLSDPSLDLAILDNRFPDGRALDLLTEFGSDGLPLPVVLLTGHGSIDLAIQAIKLGAEHFLTKPVEMEALRVVVQRILESQRVRRRERAGKPRGSSALDPFLGGSEEIEHLRQEAETAAPSHLPLLLRGETGTGKGVLARWIHDHSARRGEPFVDVNCAGLRQDFVESELFGHEKGAFTGAEGRKQGLLEVAHRGTLFLDEIGDMTLAVQKKILKVLEEKRFRRLGGVTDLSVDVRVLAATHRPLEDLIRGGDFRQDLFFRISSVTLGIPPLRRRRADLVALAHCLLGGVGRSVGRPHLEIDAAAMDCLEAYSWPGNIREMKNVLERAALFAREGRIEPRDMALGPGLSLQPAALGWDTTLTLDELESQHIRRVLAEEEGRIASAARRLGIHRSTLYEKVRKYGIDAD